MIPSVHSNSRDGIAGAAFSSDGALLAIDDYGTIRVLDLTDPANPVERAALTRSGSSPTSFTLTFSPDGNTLAAAGESPGISFWDLSDLRDAILRPEGRAARVTR